MKLTSILGGYGKVMRCTHKSTGEVRAVKIMDKAYITPPEQTRLKYEIDILKNLTHPNILRLFEVFEDLKNIYLVTELCEGGELFDEIMNKKSFSEKDAAQIIK
jgi:calcium-dependent protein kinase